MPGSPLPKRLLYGELCQSKRSAEKNASKPWVRRHQSPHFGVAFSWLSTKQRPLSHNSFDRFPSRSVRLANLSRVSVKNKHWQINKYINNSISAFIPSPRYCYFVSEHRYEGWLRGQNHWEIYLKRMKLANTAKKWQQLQLARRIYSKQSLFSVDLLTYYWTSPRINFHLNICGYCL